MGLWTLFEQVWIKLFYCVYCYHRKQWGCEPYLNRFGSNCFIVFIVITGTNGGVTLMGSVFSLLGGGLVGLAYYLTQIFLLRESFLGKGPPQWPLLIVGVLMGFLGSTIDSLLGATFQYSGNFLKISKIHI